MNFIAWLVVIGGIVVVGINLFGAIREYIEKRKSKGNKPDDNDKKEVND